MKHQLGMREDEFAGSGARTQRKRSGSYNLRKTPVTRWVRRWTQSPYTPWMKTAQVPPNYETFMKRGRGTADGKSPTAGDNVATQVYIPSYFSLFFSFVFIFLQQWCRCLNFSAAHASAGVWGAKLRQAGRHATKFIAQMKRLSFVHEVIQVGIRVCNVTWRATKRKLKKKCNKRKANSQFLHQSINLARDQTPS